jgi:hypothetical protein
LESKFTKDTAARNQSWYHIHSFGRKIKVDIPNYTREASIDRAEMAINQSQKPDDVTSIPHTGDKPSAGRHGKKESQSAADVPKVDKERADTEDGSGNNDSTSRGPGNNAEQVEALGDGIESESATSGGNQQETKSKSGKKSNDTLGTPADSTSSTPGQVDPGDSKDSGFIEDICSKVGAIALLDQVIGDPYDSKLKENFSEALDRQILERQRDIGNTDNLLLSMLDVASLVVDHAKAKEKAKRFKSRVDKEPAGELKDSYEKRFQHFEQAKHGLNDKWKAVLGAKGYPHEWITRLEARDDEIKIHWKLEGHSFDPTEELRKQKALACQIWGVSKIDEADSSEYLSWTTTGEKDKKGSRKRGTSPTVESELPPRKK